jgi:lipid II:glycine glycyltransferase (peptidoglycan interpeptide bridge formation enzyme)
MAGATIGSPRIPILSRFCREVSFNALPVTKPSEPNFQQAVLMAFEKKLRQIGVFQFHVQSHSSPHAASILPALGYKTTTRYEFHLSLSDNLDDNWTVLRNERRKKVRKAERNGLLVVEASDIDGVRSLLNLNSDALSRKDITISVENQRIDSIIRCLLGSSQATLLTCYSGSTPVGALLYGTFGENACTLLSGSTHEGNKLGTNILLHWRMVENLTKRNVTSLNIGAVTLRREEDPSSNGLFQFKKDLGGNPILQPSGVKVLPGVGKFIRGLRSRYR